MAYVAPFIIAANPISTSRLPQAPDSQELNAEYNLVYDGKSYQPDAHIKTTDGHGARHTSLPQTQADGGVQQPLCVGSLTRNQVTTGKYAVMCSV